MHDLHTQTRGRAPRQHTSPTRLSRDSRVARARAQNKTIQARASKSQPVAAAVASCFRRLCRRRRPRGVVESIDGVHIVGVSMPAWACGQQLHNPKSGGSERSAHAPIKNARAFAHCARIANVYVRVVRCSMCAYVACLHVLCISFDAARTRVRIRTTQPIDRRVRRCSLARAPVWIK